MRKKSLSGSWVTPYLFLLPAFFLIALVLFYPLADGILSSFKNIVLTKARPEAWVGFEQYTRLFNDPMFWSAFSKSLVWLIVIVTAQYIIGFGIALLLNKDIRCKKLFRCLVLLPWVIPNAVAGIIWKWIYAEQYGLLNGLLKQMGVISSNVGWLAENSTAFWSLLLAAVWKGTPFVIIVLLAGLQAIDGSLYEAASIDGANVLHSFTRVTLPLMKKISLTVITLTSIWTFNSFELIQVVTRGGPGNATMTLPIYTYKLFNQTFQVSYASSAATLMLVVLIVPAFFYVRAVMND